MSRHGRPCVLVCCFLPWRARTRTNAYGTHARPARSAVPMIEPAVLDWRLDNASPRSSQDGPLPWLPGIPGRIAADPTWGPHLGARSRLITQLADQVRLTGGRSAGQPRA